MHGKERRADALVWGLLVGVVVTAATAFVAAESVPRTAPFQDDSGEWVYPKGDHTQPLRTAGVWVYGLVFGAMAGACAVLWRRTRPD